MKEEILSKRNGKWRIAQLGEMVNKVDRIVTVKCDCGHKRNILLTNFKRLSTWGCCNCQKLKPFKKKTRLYSIWYSMIDRCYNPNSASYKCYGGRGIKVCDRWKNDFWLFVEDMKQRPSPNHSIDRIDVNGNYEPSNCRWATRKVQMNNTRISGILTASKIAKITGYSRERIRQLTFFSASKPLDKFIESNILVNKSRRVTYNPAIIPFLINRRSFKI